MEQFEAGREFNRLVKEGASDEDLVWAKKIENDNEEVGFEELTTHAETEN